MLGARAATMLSLSARRQRGDGVREVGAAEAIGAARPREHGVDARQVGAPRRGAALADAAGDVDDGLFHAQ